MYEMQSRIVPIYLSNEDELVYESYRLRPDGSAERFRKLGTVKLPLKAWLKRNTATGRVDLILPR